MKRLIVLSVIFALVAGSVFAVDLSGTVIGDVTVMQSNTGDDAKVTSSGGMTRINLEGSGANDDETFGGWFRARPGNIWGNVWWKPIDQFKIQIGGNGGDGLIGKEGVTGWMFYQTVSDTGVADSGHNVWGAPSWSTNKTGINTRDVFYAGGLDGSDNLYLFITPAEIASINLILPFLSYSGDEIADVLKRAVVQIDLHFDFGNIALTYAGGRGHVDGDKGTTTTTWDKLTAGAGTFVFNDGSYYADDGTGNAAGTGLAGTGGIITGTTSGTGDDLIFWKKGSKTEGAKDEINEASKFYLYAGLSVIENLAIDVGFSYTLPYTTDSKTKVTAPIGAGLGLKYTAGDLGVKFRTVATFGGSATPDGGDAEKVPLALIADVLPYYALSETLTAFVSVGIWYNGKADAPGAESVLGWRFNPYLQVGAEWGAKFLAGIKVWSDGREDGGKKITNWAVPIAMIASF